MSRLTGGSGAGRNRFGLRDEVRFGGHSPRRVPDRDLSQAAQALHLPELFTTCPKAFAMESI
jgi:hypothetical protein